MKLITLTKGLFTEVDDIDYEIYNKLSYHAHFGNRKLNKNYAVRSAIDKNGKSYKIYLHKEILGIKDFSKIQGDHIDGNSLNNQKYNLRIANSNQNNSNVKSHLDSTSKYLGVSWSKNHNKWISQIQNNGKRYYLGLFTDEDDAAIAYNEAAIKYHKNFANLNQL